MAVPGFFAGGMIGVAVAKVVGQLRRCAPEEGLPACDYQWFLLAGAIVGAILLPSVIIWRLRRPRAAVDGTNSADRS